MPKKKISKVLIVVLVILVLAVVGLSLKIYLNYRAEIAAQPLSPEEKANAITKGINWLLKTDQPFEDMGVVWAVKEMNNQYCGRDDLENLWQIKKEDALKIDEYQEAYLKLFDLDYDFEFSESDLQDKIQVPMDDIFIPIIYCEEKGISNRVIDMLKNLSDQGGYLSAHALLGATWLKERGCYGEEEVQKIIEAKVAELIDAQNREREYSDLYGERVAILEYAGYKNRISKDWIKIIVKAQNEDGGWTDREVSEDESDYHATALTTWALVQHVGKCGD